jgi:imidazolonepropionase-like amidohydrolase
MHANALKLEGLKEIESADSSDLSDVRTAGSGATAPGGHPAETSGPAIPTITRPEQAEAFVDARIREGSDFIKAFYDDLSAYLPEGRRLPMMSRETLRGLVEASHKRGKLVVVHIGTEQQARDAINAGADGLAHMFTGKSAGADFGKFAASRGVFVIPTLAMLYSTSGESGGPALLV